MRKSAVAVICLMLGLTAVSGAAGLQVRSAAFAAGQLIPKKYTCDGVNASPPLSWSGVPKQARTLALIVNDPDAPAGDWVHWVLYNLPATESGLAEGTPAAMHG